MGKAKFSDDFKRDAVHQIMVHPIDLNVKKPIKIQFLVDCDTL